jgi:hypothetical protein
LITTSTHAVFLQITSAAYAPRRSLPTPETIGGRQIGGFADAWWSVNLDVDVRGNAERDVQRDAFQSPLDVIRHPLGKQQAL